MLKAIAIMLGNGFEAALLIAVMIIWLRHAGKLRLVKWVYAGAGAAAAAGWLVLYPLKVSGPKKESFTGWMMALCFVLEILLVIWMSRELRGPRSGGKRFKKLQWNSAAAETVFTVISAAALTILPLMRLLLFPSSIFIQTYSVVNTELVLKFSGGGLGLLLCFIFGMSFLRSARVLPVRSSLAGSAVLLAALMLNQLFTVVQILFARGVFPLTPLAMKILIPVINNMDKYLYVLLGAALLWTVLILWHAMKNKQVMNGEWNPAVRRKFKAGLRSSRRWMAAAAALMVMIPVLLGVEAVLANQTVELSPAEPVTPNAEHQVVIPAAEVDDHNLHRFGYTAADGTLVRFIIIRKSETMYGVGFDACKICGSSGYYQKNGKIICRKCDVIMNIPTIGFEGGCNPIPLVYRMDKGNLIIASCDLEKETDTFHQEDMFN
ncbi:Fe-S-containing protein [Paenibacillus sp. MMS20-IR301]|uniref:Fe-S-containing protein n=1 Tax=Paenibacillus sp. MMS20-IR301 TaxID=2895946 RepID=UPI0028EB653B|nr:Fe-S-containing protein [Paenibacillus sp. MMS20-IR301]WNS40685.1 Fe-S-containing protein [Paenibacillus sp. MMS20-IR301]